jgi:hypothetical protein
MAVLVVSLGIALLLIVVSILLLHISSAVETVRIRRRLECSECLVLTVLTSGSITMGIYLCLQAGVFLVVCWVGVTNELTNMWHISGYTYAIAFIGHVLALGSSLCYFMLSEKMSSNVTVDPVERFEYERVQPLLNGNSASNLETGIVGVHVGGDFNALRSDTKPTSITDTCDTDNILLCYSSEEGIDPISVIGYKQSSKCTPDSSSKSNPTIRDLFMYLILFLSTTVGTLYTLHATRDDVLNNRNLNQSLISASPSFMCLIVLFLTVIIIIGTIHSLVSSARFIHHILCSSLAIVMSMSSILICQSDCDSLTSSLIIVGVVSVTLTVWHMMAEEVKCYALLRSNVYMNSKNFIIHMFFCQRLSN